MLNKLDQDIKEYLMSGDKQSAEALRFLKSVLINAKIATGHELNEEETIKVIRKEIKLRVEAKTLYLANQRNELAAKEDFEYQIYTKYVPEELDQEDILKIINMSAKTCQQPLNMGNLMSVAMKEIAGRADGRAVSEAVKKYLEENK